MPLLLTCAACTPAGRQVASHRCVSAFTYDHEGITRGDRSRRELALVFTADLHGEGTQHVLDVLARRGVRASFFLTGNYLRDARHRGFVPRMVREGHYVGPHSHAHLLYASWEDRQHSLVNREEFLDDLSRNLDELRRLGALSDTSTMRQPVYFIPPYEWYNRDHAAWAREIGVQMVNFTPGIGSHRDYLPESDPGFRSSRAILDDMLAFEERDPGGLNGAIVLLHLGADREDKMFLLLDVLLDELAHRGYSLRRMDDLLALPR